MGLELVLVFDLDGVIRHFDSLELDAQIEAELGLPAGTLWELVMESGDLDRAVVGGFNRRQWEDRIEAELRAGTRNGADVAASFQRWRDNVGKADPEMTQLIEELPEVPVFLFTNGTDRVPEELVRLGIDGLFAGVLNSYNYGLRKPDPAAYLAAHREIQAVLGLRVPREQVFFTDDKVKNVQAALDFGWRAEVFQDAARYRQQLDAVTADSARN
ncbi:putative hydrolase of the HAD superfamily [Psychromicrobium silvestre]|uniref:Putative hydrolase of the HAD superfamily n=1 Tax=Psychromicrobium silvestre TaxID=1645614 RepID=A0A7Y9S6V1_9MICC|nr:HAD-IA family hydrolase [Psychromicrobium silvestre]NYE95225.1 putative hydrolase of the HAD superfamily [Psychromicrobium silvestre]